MRPAAKKADMVLDRVDDEDHVVSRIRRGDVFHEKAGFRVVHVFLFDTQGRLLLQRLAPQKERHPRRWGSSVAGYVAAGEEYDAAAKRRTRAELGRDDLQLRRVTKTRMDDSGCTKFIMLYEAQSDGPFKPDETEIQELQFAHLDAIYAEIRADPECFTPTFTYLLENHLRPNRAR